MPNVISKMGFPSKSSLPVIIILTLFIVTFYNTHHRSPPTTTTTTTQHKDKRTFHYFQSIFLSSASNYTLAAYLRDLTLHPHLAGTPPSLRTALYVRSHFESLGLQTYTTNHTVLLSYPLYSSLTAHFSNGSVINLPLSEPGASRNGVVAPYHAYSPSGSVLGQPVFLNHGRDQDYVAVGKHGVDVKGCIGIVRRGGGLSRNAVVEKAAAHGVVAVLMYTDGETFSGGVERGTVMKGLGDPLSPGWAGAEGGEKLRLNDPRVAERFPKVPSMPVSADTAETILGSMDGARMPQDWRGALKSRSSSEFGRVGPDRILLNFTYMGERKMATIHNIFAVIKGSEEPDRFILLGNHRDAWTYGAVDPNSGTSALLDVARRFALMMHLGWNPRRTIIFGSWDAEEFGMIGSTEWVEKNLMNLGAKAVAYLNVDCAVQGPGFFAGATPQLDDLLFEVTKKVKDPDSENVSIFETSKVFNEGINIQRLSGVDSDFAPFLQHAGVPSIDMYYGRDFPVYHTAFDSYDWMVSYGDPLFQRHVAVSGVWGLIALHLADDPILPFNYLSYADQLQEYTNTLNNVLEGDISLHPITLAIQDLRAAAAEIAEEIKKLSDDVTMDEFFLLKLRMLNDRLMFAERGFLDSEGLRGLQWFKHLVHGPQTNGESEVNSFPGVADAIYRSRWMNKEERKEAIEHEVWRVARAIQRASCLLKGDFT